MILKYEKINKDNIVIASKIQYEIFPNSSAYSKYLKEICAVTSIPVTKIYISIYTSLNKIGEMRFCIFF